MLFVPIAGKRCRTLKDIGKSRICVDRQDNFATRVPSWLLFLNPFQSTGFHISFASFLQIKHRVTRPLGKITAKKLFALQNSMHGSLFMSLRRLMTIRDTGLNEIPGFTPVLHPNCLLKSKCQKSLNVETKLMNLFFFCVCSLLNVTRLHLFSSCSLWCQVYCCHFNA